MQARYARLTERLLRQPSASDVRLARAKVAIALDRPAAAGRDLFVALSIRPDWATQVLDEHPSLVRNPFAVELLAPTTPLAAAVLALADERAADALAELELAELLDRGDASAEFVASVALPMTGRDEEGLLRARSAAALWPRFADAHFNVASAHAAAGASQEAIDDYERVLGIEPDHEGAAHNLVMMLRVLNRLEEARAVGARLRVSAPLAFLARFRHAETLVCMGALDDAREELAALLPYSEGARHALADNPYFAPLMMRPDWAPLSDL